jgi:hypothetical protein
MPHTGEISLRVRSRLTGTSDLASVSSELDKPYSVTLGNGTGLGQANNAWHDRRTLAGGANEDLDMAGGLTNALGVALVFTKIKSITFYSDPANTANFTISRPATNGLPLFAAAGDAFVLTPGDVFQLTNRSLAGIAVTAGTGDLINVAVAAAAVGQSYEVIIQGVV